MKIVQTAGAHYRVADPDWDNPLDATYSLRRGGRWNAPGTNGALYFNCDISTARLNARNMLRTRTLAGMPFSFDDLDPAGLPVLVTVNVPPANAVDAVSDEGLLEVGLPETFPYDATGDIVTWAKCQPVGAAAVLARVPAIASRSAAPGTTHENQELTWFPSVGGTLECAGLPQPFNHWFGDY
ncbi:MAG: RES domain-containing protein [Actinobacteria bacterium]|nr:RES domain-containing protein [Actinomycetota bacterium]